MFSVTPLVVELLEISIVGDPLKADPSAFATWLKQIMALVEFVKVNEGKFIVVANG